MTGTISCYYILITNSLFIDVVSLVSVVYSTPTTATAVNRFLYA